MTRYPFPTVTRSDDLGPKSLDLPEETRYYHQILRENPQISLSQKKGLEGEVKARFEILKRIRRMIPYPFPQCRLTHSRLSSQKPDLVLKNGNVIVGIEVKNWAFNGFVTSLHILQHAVRKRWPSSIKILLFVIPREITKKARQVAKQHGITIVNGLNQLMSTLVGLCAGSFIVNAVDIGNGIDRYVYLCSCGLVANHLLYRGSGRVFCCQECLDSELRFSGFGKVTIVPLGVKA